jgi:hypothetical protein
MHEHCKYERLNLTYRRLYIVIPVVGRCRKRGAPRRSPRTKAGAGGMPREITQKYDINTCAQLTEKQFFFVQMGI